MSRDCHDYFIKNGKHIGRYEDMYRACHDPWRIEELGPRLDMKAALLLLSGRERSISRFLDVGAGLGLFTALLCRTLWAENPSCQGLVTDISATAVAGAENRLRDPRLSFMVLDARVPAPLQRLDARFDLIILAQTLWGLLEDLPGALSSLASLLPSGGLMLITQHFPDPEKQTYGREVVSGPEDLSRHLRQAGFSLLDTLETNRTVNHHWAALMEKRL